MSAASISDTVTANGTIDQSLPPHRRPTQAADERKIYQSRSRTEHCTEGQQGSSRSDPLPDISASVWSRAKCLVSINASATLCQTKKAPREGRQNGGRTPVA